jgi:hypothetical protein
LKGLAAPPPKVAAGNGKQPEPKNQAAAPTGWVMIPEAPKDADFKPGTDIMMARMSHRAELKNGKRVTWPRKSL